MTDMHGLWLRLVDSGHLLLDFMGAGGMVMWALALLCVLYWTLVFERVWYMRRCFHTGPTTAAGPGSIWSISLASGSALCAPLGLLRRSSSWQDRCA